MLIYVVQPGDTAVSIAENSGIPLEQLIYDNELRTPSALAVGQALLITGAGEAPSPLRLQASGYAYPFTQEELLGDAFPVLEEVLSFSNGFSPGGWLYPFDDSRLRALAVLSGLAVTLVLTPMTEGGTFDSGLVHTALSDLAVQERLTEQLVQKTESLGYAGIHVDWEFIEAADRDRYTAFIGRLRDALHPLGRSVSAALVPKTSDSQAGRLYEGMDYAGLGDAADTVILMTYEWGYTYGPPMAVAPLNQVRRVAEYAVSRIPREKIVLGMPNYAYDWVLPCERGATKATTIGNIDAVQIAAANQVQILYSQQAQTPWFRYSRSGITHEVWFEDVRSIKAKLLLASELGLLGVSYWNLLRSFRPNWVLLAQLLSP